MKIGSLFTGYGGLDQAVEEYFGAETVSVWLMVPGDYTGGRTYDELCNRVHDPVWAEGDDE